MKAKLDGIYSPDLPSGYGELPDDPRDCWVVIHADIGTDCGLGMDCFTLYVTTPIFLERSIRVDLFQTGRGLLIVNEFDWGVVEDAISSVCLEIEAETWQAIVSQLSMSFLYEYEQ